jgi:hypothetical protein
MVFGDEDEARRGAPGEAPSTETDSASRRLSTKSNSPPPVFHPLAYREVVAGWSVEWRERWGRRANALEDNGLSWRDAEAQAFVEIWTQLRNQSQDEPATSSLEPSDAERN